MFSITTRIKTMIKTVAGTGSTVALTALFFVLLLGVVPQPQVSAEQLTTVAIVDINRVYNSFYRDSQAVRDLERVRREYQQEIDDQVRELESLRDRRTRMAEIGNDRRAEELDQEIAEMQRFLEDLAQRRRRQLELRQQSLMSNEFLRSLQEAVQYVAESEGYTVVMRTDQQGLQWWSAEVDISEMVVQRLIQIVDR
ncbi:MAG: OmpH family outer membrane protein [Alkalispirochaeta sp.]